MWQKSCDVWFVTTLLAADNMKEITQAIREKAKLLLEENKVKGVLGFTPGTLPMARRPILATTLEQAERLCWDEFCLMNLANFIPPRGQERIAVVAKGCDWRNLIVHDLEGRIDLENEIEVLGISCKGMLDTEKINQSANGAERVVGVICNGDEVQIKLVDGKELILEKDRLIRQACRECRQPTPDSSIILNNSINDSDKQKSIVSEHAFDSSDFLKNIDLLQSTFKECLMCFACRDACPLCYCDSCFVDTEKSHWLSHSSTLEGLLDFHFLRAHHIAGRCTSCGTCESACPMNIPVRELVKKLNHDVEETTGYIPGITKDMKPPKSIFKPSYHEHKNR
jgi:formate dehydrogenase (coenzyme F420) beta subunit